MDAGVIQDRVDRRLVAVHDVEHAVGQPGFLEQLGHADRGRRHLLGRLQDEGVAAGDRHREHPQRHHRRKIERRDARADADRLAQRCACRPAVPTFSEYSPFSRCGMPQANSTTSMPRCTEPIASASVLPCSSVTSSASGFLVFLQERQKFLHDARAPQDGGVSRHSGNAAACGRDRRVDHAACRRTRHALGDLPGRRVVDLAIARGGSDGLAADPGGDGVQLQVRRACSCDGPR